MALHYAVVELGGHEIVPEQHVPTTCLRWRRSERASRAMDSRRETPRCQQHHSNFLLQPLVVEAMPAGPAKQVNEEGCAVKTQCEQRKGGPRKTAHTCSPEPPTFDAAQGSAQRSLINGHQQSERRFP